MKTMVVRIALILTAADKARSESYLAEILTTYAVAKNWSDLDFKVRATPTLVLADQNGIVRRVWVGKVSPEAEGVILNILKRPSELDRADDGSEQPVAKSPSPAAAEYGVVIDPRERQDYKVSHSPNAINIPSAELNLRAPLELDRADVQSLDCANISRAACARYAAVLVRLGFSVTTLNAGAISQSCDLTAVDVERPVAR